MGGPAGHVLGNAGEVCVVLRPELVNPQHGLIATNLGDGDTIEALSAVENPGLVPVPGEAHGEVPIGDGTKHGHALAQAEFRTNTELVQGGRD